MKVKIKGQSHQGQNRHFSAPTAACVRFMFDEIFLASSLIFPDEHVHGPHIGDSAFGDRILVTHAHVKAQPSACPGSVVD